MKTFKGFGHQYRFVQPSPTYACAGKDKAVAVMGVNFVLLEPHKRALATFIEGLTKWKSGKQIVLP